MMIRLTEVTEFTAPVTTQDVFINKYQVQAIRSWKHEEVTYTEIQMNNSITVVTEPVSQVVYLMEIHNAASAQK